MGSKNYQERKCTAFIFLSLALFCQLAFPCTSVLLRSGWRLPGVRLSQAHGTRGSGRYCSSLCRGSTWLAQGPVAVMVKLGMDFPVAPEPHPCTVLALAPLCWWQRLDRSQRTAVAGCSGRPAGQMLCHRSRAHISTSLNLVLSLFRRLPLSSE